MLFGTLTIQAVEEERLTAIDVDGLRYLVDGSDNATGLVLAALARNGAAITIVGAHMSNDLSVERGPFSGGMLEIYEFVVGELHYDAASQRWLTANGALIEEDVPAAQRAS